MAVKSHIEWTNATWNPVSGCSKYSAGCMHCYAEKMARRLQAMGMPKYERGFQVILHPELLSLPGTWRKPRLVFVNSMSDLFHEEVPREFIREVFAVMQRTPQHVYQILTKRSPRLVELAPELPWAGNIWMGVTVESQPYTRRIDDLRSVPAAGRFLSIEPLLGRFDRLDLSGIDWVICGGESGTQARPVEEAWVTCVRDHCGEQGVAFFFKQWGGRDKHKNGRMLQGRLWEETPEKLTDYSLF